MLRCGAEGQDAEAGQDEASALGGRMWGRQGDAGKRTRASKVLGGEPCREKVKPAVLPTDPAGVADFRLSRRRHVINPMCQQIN